MKKIKTDSPFTFIMESLSKKVVRQYKRNTKESYGYPRTIKESKILKLLEGTNVRHPKLLKTWFTYIEEEYIEGKVLTNTFDRNVMINIVCNYIYEMTKVDCTKIKKYVKWNNNSEFLHYQVDYLIKTLNKSKNIERLKVIGLDINSILAYKNVMLDDQRRMYLIHGDIERSNIIEKNNEYTLIDWEQSTYGDVAYELAMHFILENYSIDEINVVIDRLCASLGMSQTNLIKDIKMYNDFEIVRRSFLKMNRVIALAKKNKPFEEELQDAYKDYSKISNTKTCNELRSIFSFK